MLPASELAWCFGEPKMTPQPGRLRQQSTSSSVVTPTEFAVLAVEGYTINRLIGQGAYGSVFVSRHEPSDSLRAVKAVAHADVDRAEVENEIRIMRKIPREAHIVQLFEVVEDPAFTFLCMEACTGGHLLHRLWEHRAQFTEAHASRAMRDLLDALVALHSVHVIHRDIKPQNLLYVNKRPDAPLKLIDFGVAVDLGSPTGKVRDFAGSIRFMSPSVVVEEPYGADCDLWSAGVVTFLLLCGQYPFDGASVEEVAEKIVKQEPDFSGSEWALVSAEAKDFVRKLIRDPFVERNRAARLAQQRKPKKAAAGVARQSCRAAALRLRQGGAQPPVDRQRRPSGGGATPLQGA